MHSGYFNDHYLDDDSAWTTLSGLFSDVSTVSVFLNLRGLFSWRTLWLGRRVEKAFSEISIFSILIRPADHSFDGRFGFKKDLIVVSEISFFLHFPQPKSMHALIQFSKYQRTGYHANSSAQ